MSAPLVLEGDLKLIMQPGRWSLDGLALVIDGEDWELSKLIKEHFLDTYAEGSAELPNVRLTIEQVQGAAP